MQTEEQIKSDMVSTIEETEEEKLNHIKKQIRNFRKNMLRKGLRSSNGKRHRSFIKKAYKR